MKFYCEDKEAVLHEIGSNEQGLSSSEAKKRLEANGKNKLDAAPGKSLIRRFLEQLTDPMIIILLAAAAISGVLAVIENETMYVANVGDSRLYLLRDNLEQITRDHSLVEEMVSLGKMETSKAMNLS